MIIWAKAYGLAARLTDNRFDIGNVCLNINRKEARQARAAMRVKPLPRIRSRASGFIYLVIFFYCNDNLI